MIYQIYYKETRPSDILFDIEIFITQSNISKNKDNYYVELKASSFISGVIDYFQDKKDLINIEEFKKDCEYIEDLRGWLYETHNNQMRSNEQASLDYKKWREDIVVFLKEFCNKYHLYLNED